MKYIIVVLLLLLSFASKADLHYDSAKMKYYINVYPMPVSWDSTLTEAKKLYVSSTSVVGDSVAIGWETHAGSGRLRTGSLMVSKAVYDAWPEDYIFIYLADKLRFDIFP